MSEDVERLRWLLARFRENPPDPELTALARDLADRFTLDQLEAMAAGHPGEVRRLFEFLCGYRERSVPAHVPSEPEASSSRP